MDQEALREPGISPWRPNAERAAPPSLAQFGIPGSAVTENVVRGWSFAALDQANLEAVAIENKVDQIAADPAIDFVSPVFLDSHADPYIVTRDILEKYLPQQLDGLRFLLCGPEPMTEAVTEALEAMGVERAHIKTELFDMV